MRTTKPIILVVEDSNTMWNFYLNVMGDQYALVRAKDGRQALMQATRVRPALIILDWTLDAVEDDAPLDAAGNPMEGLSPRTSEISGLDVLRVVKRSPLKSVPVIMLTGRSGFHERLMGKLSQADKYLVKPVDEGLLLKTVEGLLSKQGTLSTK